MKKALTNIILSLVIIALFSVIGAAQGIETDMPVVQSFLLNQNPDPAKTGDAVEVRLRFQNNGGAEARDIWVEFTEEYPFTLISGEEKRQTIQSLPHWPEEENSKTLTFKLRVDREAIAGQYDAKFRYSMDQGVSWYLKGFSIEVTTKEFAEIIYIDKTKLTPGEETELVFTINNIGNTPLQNMVFKWNEPANIILPVNTDNTRYIKYLAPGDSMPLKYTVIADVNAEPGLYALNLNLEYDIKNLSSSTQKETVSTQAGVFVGGETDFDVSFSESSNGATSFSVSNIGSVPAYSVSVIIPQQQGWRVSGSNSMIIGNLNKGDYTVASFNLQPMTARQNSQDENEEAQRSFFQDSQVVKVQVVYTDTMGKRNTVEKEVQIGSQSLMGGIAGTSNGQIPAGFTGRPGMRQQQGFFAKNKWYVLVLAVLVLGYIEHNRYKHRKDRELKFIPFLKEEVKSLISRAKNIFKRKKK